MNLGKDILKILNKRYPPNTLVEATFKNLDLAFKTDQVGWPVLLFLGKKMNTDRFRESGMRGG